ncbi:hypothetical protein [Vibrio parahaemolyticus]|uniref:hypothetical protein n=1 Tax=Vibrio parahaemolyticus TaxID=670 RepID=UPI001F2BD763|nr:hypothetical protein [Vibrio parahaemolyticus]
MPVIVFASSKGEQEKLQPVDYLLESLPDKVYLKILVSLLLMQTQTNMLRSGR